jgi:hypothetical protein
MHEKLDLTEGELITLMRETNFDMNCHIAKERKRKGLPPIPGVLPFVHGTVKS